MPPYRAPGRSARSGRTNTDNEVFEGLPVKQWGQSYSKVLSTPQVTEIVNAEDDKWGEPPMPRDYQLLNTYTQQLLRFARSGKTFLNKRKSENDEDDKPDDDPVEDIPKENMLGDEDRGYTAKKWRPVPESQLEPEHKHFAFLAKRRKGLSSLYGPDQSTGAMLPLRKTKVAKTDAAGTTTIYEVLVPEGHVLEGEITDLNDLENKPITTPAPGTVIEGVGVANEDGVLVADILQQRVGIAAPRRNRPPPKKKGGPGRGKKRVTFVNADGSTYTTIVGNATKIQVQPGQTVKHVARGETAMADITPEEAAARAAERAAAKAARKEAQGEDGGDDGEGEGEGEGEGDGDDDGSGSEEGEMDEDGDDDREEGEIEEDDAPATTATATPAAGTPAPDDSLDVKPTDAESKDEVMGDMEPEAEAGPNDSAAVTEEASAALGDDDVVPSPVIEAPADQTEDIVAQDVADELLTAIEQPSGAEEDVLPAGEPEVATTMDTDVPEKSADVVDAAVETAIAELAANPTAEEAEARVPQIQEAEASTVEAKDVEMTDGAVQETAEPSDAFEKAEEPEDDLLANLEKHITG